MERIKFVASTTIGPHGTLDRYRRWRQRGRRRSQCRISYSRKVSSERHRGSEWDKERWKRTREVWANDQSDWIVTGRVNNTSIIASLVIWRVYVNYNRSASLLSLFVKELSLARYIFLGSPTRTRYPTPRISGNVWLSPHLSSKSRIRANVSLQLSRGLDCMKVPCPAICAYRMFCEPQSVVGKERPYGIPLDSVCFQAPTQKWW